MPNSRRRASTIAPTLAERPNKPTSTATASSAYVTANVRSKIRSDAVLISPGPETSSSLPPGSARSAAVASTTVAPGALDIHCTLDDDGALLARVVAPHARNDELPARAREGKSDSVADRVAVAV